MQPAIEVTVKLRWNLCHLDDAVPVIYMPISMSLVGASPSGEQFVFDGHGGEHCAKFMAEGHVTQLDKYTAPTTSQLKAVARQLDTGFCSEGTRRDASMHVLSQLKKQGIMAPLQEILQLDSQVLCLAVQAGRSVLVPDSEYNLLIRGKATIASRRIKQPSWTDVLMISTPEKNKLHFNQAAQLSIFRHQRSGSTGALVVVSH